MSTIKVNNITPLTGTHISGSFNGVFSGSIVNSRIDNLENFSSSLDAAFATDVQLHQLYQATSSIHNFTSSIRNEISAIEAWTASLDNTYATDAQLYKLYQTTSSLNNYTGSNDSVLQRIMQTTASLNSKTGSYATTGSNTFIGTETISGSIFISGSIIPNGSGSYDLGSIEHPWRDLYISTASIKLIRDGEVVNSVSSIISEITASNTVISKETLLIDGNIVVKDGGLRRMRITSGSVRFDVAYDDIDESSEYTNHSLRAYYGASDPDFIDRWGVGLQSNFGNVYLDSPNGNIILSSSILISGSIIPSTNSTSYTSSYSLGSSTNAWKELWVSNGSVNFVDPNSGDTASISLNERNVLSVPQIESVGNLNVTGSFGAKFIDLNGSWEGGGAGGDGGMITFGGSYHRIYNHTENHLGLHSHKSINFYLGKLYDENSKFNFTGSVKLHGDKAPGRLNPFDTTLEVIGDSEFSGSVYVSGSNSTIVLPNHSSAPSLPNSGALYFNTTDFHFYGWNGGQWKQLDN